jgi:hypothetical protein
VSGICGSEGPFAVAQVDLGIMVSAMESFAETENIQEKIHFYPLLIELIYRVDGSDITSNYYLIFRFLSLIHYTTQQWLSSLLLPLLSLGA